MNKYKFSSHKWNNTCKKLNIPININNDGKMLSAVDALERETSDTKGSVEIVWKELMSELNSKDNTKESVDNQKIDTTNGTKESVYNQKIDNDSELWVDDEKWDEYPFSRDEINIKCLYRSHIEVQNKEVEKVQNELNNNNNNIYIPENFDYTLLDKLNLEEIQKLEQQRPGTLG